MKLSAKECIAFGWRTFKARPWFFVGLSVIAILISFLTGVVQSNLEQMLGKDAGDAVSTLISLGIDSLIGIGFITVYLKAHDAVMSPIYHDLWNPKPFWRYLGAYLLVMVCVVVGFILLIVPGVIVGLMLAFATIMVVDKGLGPIEAMKESARITKGHRLELLGLVGLTIAVNILGLLALVVGLLVSVPVSTLAMMHAYRALSKSEETPSLPLEPVAIV